MAETKDSIAQMKSAPESFIDAFYMFLWKPNLFDDWYWHGISTELELGQKVIAEVEDGEDTIRVEGTVKQWGDSKGTVVVSYPDPNSHAFCCVLRLEQQVDASAVTRRTPYGFACAFEGVILFLIALNILTFILETLSYFGKGTKWNSAFDILEDVSVGVFTLEYFMRFYACVGARDGTTGEFLYQGLAGRFKYAATDFYALLDLAAILPFYVDLALVDIDIAPTTFLRALRLLRLLKADREADMLSKFDDVIVEIGPMLVATGYVGVVFWLLAATAMYYCEKDNEELGGRMSSIPGSMYFTMQMLMGEFVLNNQFTVPGKCVATVIAIFGAIFFSIPVGLFGGAFLSLAGGEDDEGEDEDEDDEALEVKAKLEEEKENAIRLANQQRAWKAVDEADGCYLKARAASCYVLSAYGILGKGFTYLTMLLIGLTVVTTVVDSTKEGHSNETFRSFELVIELICVCIFTIEYVLRVWCVIDSFDERSGRKEYTACKGRMSFIFSFFGLVDLLSVLPFFLAVSIEGNTDVVSTPVMQVLRLVRILKIERTISAFTLFDNVWSQSKTLLIGLGYVVIVLWLVFSCLMYLAERNHKSVAPDDDIIDHPYSNMLEAMWYTLLNITGEFPLGDYSVAGKILGIFMVVFAIELYGAASGVFAEGFQSAVEKTGTRKDVW